ncbi:LOW QUALITY PROTEIN: uncharacterized protein C20orf204 homolog [Sarcophilus harrisii]
MTRDPAFPQVLAKPAFCMLLLAILDSALGRGGRRKDCNVPDVLRHYRAVIFEELQAVVRKTPRGLLCLGKGHGLWDRTCGRGLGLGVGESAGAAYSCLLGQGQFLLWFYPEKLGKHQGSQAPGTRASRGRLLSGRKGNFSEKRSCSTRSGELGKGVWDSPRTGAGIRERGGAEMTGAEPDRRQLQSLSGHLLSPSPPGAPHLAVYLVHGAGSARVCGGDRGRGRRGALEKAVWAVATHTEAVTREYCGTLHQVRPRPHPHSRRDSSSQRRRRLTCEGLSCPSGDVWAGSPPSAMWAACSTGRGVGRRETPGRPLTLSLSLSPLSAKPEAAEPGLAGAEARSGDGARAEPGACPCPGAEAGSGPETAAFGSRGTPGCLLGEIVLLALLGFGLRELPGEEMGVGDCGEARASSLGIPGLEKETPRLPPTVSPLRPMK